MSSLKLRFSEVQEQYFYGDTARYRIMPKGRRCGFTHGCANHILDDGFKASEYYLWVDTIEKNIDRYVDRYFLPALKDLPSSMYDWKQQKKELSIGNTQIDFRSAEKPENIEGFGYHKIIINEAGIILKGKKGRYLWTNAIVPMMADYDQCVAFIGGTPKGKTGKDGRACLYYEMAERYKYNPKYSTTVVTTEENPFLSEKGVAEVRAELTEGAVLDQEYYGKFIDAGAGIIKGEWIKIETVPLQGRRCRSWDLGVTEKKYNDPSAGGLLCYGANNEFQLQDMMKGHWVWPDLKRIIMQNARQDGQHIPIVIEEAGQQIALIDDLRRQPAMKGFTIIQMRPTGDKLARAMPWISKAEGGMFSVLDRRWTNDFITECVGFTADDTHENDDQVDSVSQGHEFLCQGSVAEITQNVFM